MLLASWWSDAWASTWDTIWGTGEWLATPLLEMTKLILGKITGWIQSWMGSLAQLAISQIAEILPANWFPAGAVETLTQYTTIIEYWFPLAWGLTLLLAWVAFLIGWFLAKLVSSCIPFGVGHH